MRCCVATNSSGKGERAEMSPPPHWAKQDYEEEQRGRKEYMRDQISRAEE